MNNFLRAVRLALRRRSQVVSVMVSAIVVGLLWGVNLSAVYPFVEVVMRGQSLPAWVDAELDRASKTIVELESSLADVRDEERAESPNRDNARYDNARYTARELQTRLDAERTVLARLEWIEPSIKRFTPNAPFPTLVWIVVGVILGTLIKSIAISVNSISVARLTQLTVFDLRKQLFRRTLKSDLGDTSPKHNGLLISHFTNDVSKLQGGLSCVFGKAILEPLKMVVCLSGACFISWRLLALSLIITPPALVLMRILAKALREANHNAMEQMGQIFRVVSETFNGLQTVKVFTRERAERRRFHEALKQHLKSSLHIVNCNAIARPISELLGIGVISLSLIAGAYLVLENETHLLGIRICNRPLSLASLLLFYGLLAGVSGPARKLSGLMVSLQTAFAASDRIYDLMDRAECLPEPATPKPSVPPHRRLQFNDVCFSYLPTERVLDHVNLEISFGETIAIVGPNGCGKSTLLNLIPRLIDPSGGSVTLDNIDLRDLSLRELRQRIGVVTQQPYLFDDTVWNNIRYGKANATDQEVELAAEQAQADQFIREVLSDGYQTHVGPRGNRLSGGQRQRIALARAILRDPEILLLDEATSQIDMESELAIHGALEEFIRNRTAIIVTHRLSTLKLADRIVVMQEGRIVDVGSHHELLLRCEEFRRLRDIHSQSLPVTVSRIRRFSSDEVPRRTASHY